MRKIVGQFGRFGLVGILATLVHIGFAFIAKYVWQVSPQMANSLGFSLAFLISYTGHLRFTFQKRRSKRIYLQRFLVLSIASFFLSSAIVYVVTTLGGGSFALAIGIVAISIPILSYIFAKFWVFEAV